MLAASVAPAWFHGIHYTLVVVVPVAAVFCVFAFTPSDEIPAAEVPAQVALRAARLRQSVGLASAVDIRRSSSSTPAPAAERAINSPALVLAPLSVGAGLIHAAVTALHFREYWLYGAFFVLSAAAQLGWAYLVARRSSRALLLTGVLGNAAIIALWLASRTIGLPIGPEPGAAEAVGWRDAFATVYEVGLVVAGWALLTGAWRYPRVVSRKTVAIMVSTIVGIAAAVAAVAGH
ncbi:MAG: hypothetical protein ACXVP8_07410 [Actinomycetota bacterium]